MATRIIPNRQLPDETLRILTQLDSPVYAKRISQIADYKSNVTLIAELATLDLVFVCYIKGATEEEVRLRKDDVSVEEVPPRSLTTAIKNGCKRKVKDDPDKQCNTYIAIEPRGVHTRTRLAGQRNISLTPRQRQLLEVYVDRDEKYPGEYASKEMVAIDPKLKTAAHNLRRPLEALVKHNLLEVTKQGYRVTTGGRRHWQKLSSLSNK